MKEEVIKLIVDEVKNPKWEATKQFLEVIELECHKGLPKIVSIELNSELEKSAVYLQVKNEPFFLEYQITNTDFPEIIGVDISPFIEVIYSVTSDDISVDELLNLTC